MSVLTLVLMFVIVIDTYVGGGTSSKCVREDGFFGKLKNCFKPKTSSAQEFEVTREGLSFLEILDLMSAFGIQDSYTLKKLSIEFALGIASILKLEGNAHLRKLFFDRSKKRNNDLYFGVDKPKKSVFRKNHDPTYLRVVGKDREKVLKALKEIIKEYHSYEEIMDSPDQAKFYISYRLLGLMYGNSLATTFLDSDVLNELWNISMKYGNIAPRNVLTMIKTFLRNISQHMIHNQRSVDYIIESCFKKITDEISDGFNYVEFSTIKTDQTRRVFLEIKKASLLALNKIIEKSESDNSETFIGRSRFQNISIFTFVMKHPFESMFTQDYGYIRHFVLKPAYKFHDLGYIDYLISKPVQIPTRHGKMETLIFDLMTHISGSNLIPAPQLPDYLVDIGHALLAKHVTVRSLEVSYGRFYLSNVKCYALDFLDECIKIHRTRSIDNDLARDISRNLKGIFSHYSKYGIEEFLDVSESNPISNTIYAIRALANPSLKQPCDLIVTGKRQIN